MYFEILPEEKGETIFGTCSALEALLRVDVGIVADSSVVQATSILKYNVNISTNTHHTHLNAEDGGRIYLRNGLNTGHIHSVHRPKCRSNIIVDQP
jgi:hypothetical protein